MVSNAEYKSLQNWAPLVFKAKFYGFDFSVQFLCAWGTWSGGSIPLHFPCLWHPFLPRTVQWFLWLLNTSPSSLASFLHLAVKNLFCQSLGSFLGCLYWCGCYLVSMGQGEHRTLLLCHLPQKSPSEILMCCSSRLFLPVSHRDSHCTLNRMREKWDILLVYHTSRKTGCLFTHTVHLHLQ